MRFHAYKYNFVYLVKEIVTYDMFPKLLVLSC